MRMIKKAVGRILYNLIGIHLPTAHCRIKFIGKMSKKFREMCGKLILDKCGDNVNIYPKSLFSSSVELGNNADIGYLARINGKCIIEDNVIMGPEVLVYTRNHITDRTDIAIQYQGTGEERPVIIGRDSWICARAIILPGVKIGKGVVVAAGAVVSKDVPDYAVVAGNPAKVVKMRNQIENDL